MIYGYNIQMNSDTSYDKLNIYVGYSLGSILFDVHL